MIGNDDFYHSVYVRVIDQIRSVILTETEQRQKAAIVICTDDCLTQCKEIIAEQFRKNELDVSFDEASKESNSSSRKQ